jgi:hypothetical protein
MISKCIAENYQDWNCWKYLLVVIGLTQGSLPNMLHFTGSNDHPKAIHTPPYAGRGDVNI